MQYSTTNQIQEVMTLFSVFLFYRRLVAFLIPFQSYHANQVLELQIQFSLSLTYLFFLFFTNISP